MSTSRNEPHTDHAIAGAVSGFVTRFLCQPLDVVKIRFQLQVEPITDHHVSKYSSLTQAFLLIYKEEGLFALWKGHVPAQLLSIVYGMVQFYSYNVFMRASQNIQSAGELNYSVKFVAGAAAGSVATAVSFPFDTVRTRLVAQSNNNLVYKGIFHSFSSIIKHEHPKVFFAGLLPTLLQIAPHTGLQFTFYGLFTDIYKRTSREDEIGFYNSMIAGSLAGLLSKTAVYPLDLSRKRLQIQGFENGRKGFGKLFQCKGLIDCIKVTVKAEGYGGLFKGLVPSQLKAGITSALHFTVYQQTLYLLRPLH